MSTKGYPTELKSVKHPKVANTERFSTISGVGYRKYATDVSPKSYYELTPTTQTANSYDAKKGVITLSGHIARVGDMIRILDAGTYNRFELEVLAVDGDDIIIDSRVLDQQPISQFKVLRAVSNLTGPDGEVSVSSGPIKIIFDGLQENVTEDTTDPSNNKPMPSKMFINKDGTILPVTKDTSVPANTVAVPVEIVSASGSNVNITAGDINIQTTHLGPNADSMRIGDGTEELAITPDNEAKVRDFGLNEVIGEKTDSFEDDETKDASLISVAKGIVKVIKDGATIATNQNLEATQQSVLGELQSLNGVDFATETTLGDIKSDVASIANDTSSIAPDVGVIKTDIASLEAKDFATETTLDDVKTAAEAIQSEAEDLNTAIGEKTDTAVTDPSLSASLIANGKGILTAENDIKDRLGVMASGLVPEVYNGIDLSYTGEDLTGVSYKLSGNVVATLTLGYTNGNLTSVVKA